MADVARKQRKRNVVGELKALAAELGCERKRQLDLSKDEFVSFHTALTAASRTPEHRQKLDSAWQSFFSGAELPDLRSYDPQLHDYIVFDNVNDMRFVLDYRALFQANTDIHTLGESRTGMYSYDVWLFRVPLVVTVDLSAKWIPQDAWIKENCHDVLLQGPSWDAELS